MKKIAQIWLALLIGMNVTANAVEINMQSTSMYNRQSVGAVSSGAVITAPGAATPLHLYTTTYDDPQATTNRARRATMDGWEDIEEEDTAGEALPIGAPLLPLVLLAVGYAVARKRTSH